MVCALTIAFLIPQQLSIVKGDQSAAFALDRLDLHGRQTAEIIAGLHAVNSQCPSGLASTEDFVIPHRSALEDALANLHAP